jgi:hypothetical protein
MDSLLDVQFQRVEDALNVLIDSITSYNPSTQAAQDLVAADDELSRGLEQCISSPYTRHNENSHH